MPGRGGLCLLLALMALAAAACGARQTPTAVSPTDTAVPLVETATPAPSTASPTPTPSPESTPAPLSASATAQPAMPAQPIDLFNAARLQPVYAVEFGAWSPVTAVAVSPDGAWLAAAAGENIALLSTADWRRVATFRVQALTHSLAFSPDSLWLAAGSRDGYLRVWQTAGFAASDDSPPGLRVEAHRKGVNTVAFSPQFGRAAGAAGWLVASGGNDAVARFWDLSTGENIGMMVGGTFAVPSIAFLPDGALLAVTNGDRIRLREVGSERIFGTFASDASLYSLAVSPDGRRLAAGGSDNLVRLYDPESAYRSGQEVYPQPVILAGHTGQADTYRALVWQVLFSPSGDLLASVGGDGALRLWDPAAAVQLVAHDAHKMGAAGVAFHPASLWLVTGGLDGFVRIWGIRP